MTQRRREHVLACGLFVVFAAVYLWPALVGGKVLSPNSVLFLFAPWAHVAPANFQLTWNPILSDIPTAYYPWNYFARQMIHAGVFPSWNPNAYSGTPFFANAQTGVLSPLNLPMWVFPLNYGLAVSAWLRLSLAGTGAYLFARELRLGVVASLLAGVSFLLCAFNMVWLTYETLPGATAMMGFAFFFGERIVQRRRIQDAAWLAVATAVAILAGHPETAVQVLAGAFLYVVLRCLVVPGQTRSERVRSAALVAGGLAVGVLLSAVGLLPVLLAGIGSPGAALRTGGTIAIPAAALKTALFPNWWQYRTLPLPGPLNYNERTFYVGVIALIMAVAALLTRDRWRDKLPLGLLAAIGVAVAFGAPVIHLLGTAVPPLNRTTTSRMLIWFEFAVPVLAGFGLQALIDAPRRLRAVWIAVAAAVLATVVAVLTVDPSLHELRTAFNELRTGRSYADPNITALASIGWWALFTAATVLVLVLWRRAAWRRWLALGLVAVAALDLLHYSHGYQPMLPARDSTPSATAAVTFLERHAGQSRVVGLGNTLTNDYDMVYGLHDVRGYDPPQPSYRYLHLWQLANPVQDPVAPFAVTTLDARGLKVMSLLGARYVIAAPVEAPVTPLMQHVVYRGPDAVIYENPDAVPAVLAPQRLVVVSGERSALAQIASARFDPRREVVVEARDATGVTAGALVSGSARATRRDQSRVELDVSLRRAGVVVLDEELASGWSVSVDGHTRPVLRVDDVLRGVQVPAGTHRVVWAYRVPGLRLGALLSALAALLLLTVAGWTLRTRIRASRTRASGLRGDAAPRAGEVHAEQP